jgi:hypothetical protein
MGSRMERHRGLGVASRSRACGDAVVVALSPCIEELA